MHANEIANQFVGAATAAVAAHMLLISGIESNRPLCVHCTPFLPMSNRNLSISVFWLLLFSFLKGVNEQFARIIAPI